MLLPGLSMLGRANGRAVLVSGDGRVIASGTASILPGTVLRPAGPVTATGPLPWMLLSGPPLVNAAGR
jgi:hypothetical protein